MFRRFRVTAAVVVIALAPLTVADAAQAQPVTPQTAAACPWPAGHPPTFYNGCVRATAGLNAHFQTTTAPVNIGNPVNYTYPFGTLVHIFCYLTGPSETGPAGTTTIWDVVDDIQLPDGTSATFGSDGYDASTDAFIFTDSNLPVVRHC